MRRRNVSQAACLCFALLVPLGCGDRDAAPEPEGPDPLETVRLLLRLHGLEGRQPEQRSEEKKNTEVDRGALAFLVADLDQHDRFLADLYVGFVIGALARNQGRLFVTRDGKRVQVTAGGAKIALRRYGDSYKVVLAESIPEEIRRRAAEEKSAFEEARRRGAQAPREGQP